MRLDLPARHLHADFADDGLGHADIDVNRAATRLRLDHRLQERHELIARVTPDRVANHFARVRIERRIQRQRAMAVVLEPTPFGTPRRQRQPRIDPVTGMCWRWSGWSRPWKAWPELLQ